MILIKTHVFLLVLFLLSGFVYGQQWAMDGTIWTFEEKYFVSSRRTPVKFYVAGDTLINSQTYKRIKADEEGFFYFPGNGTQALTYEDSGKVYLYDHTRDTNTILYDFSAEVGDTWTVQWDTCRQQIRVDSIDSLQAKGQWLKRLHVSGYYSYDGAIVEGIGHTTQLFSPDWFLYSCDPDFVYDGKFIWGLRCFEQFGFGQWNTGLVSTCNVVISGIENEERQVGFKITPNPATDLFEVSLPTFQEWHLDVIDVRGRIIFSEKFEGKRKMIESGEWSEGLYLIRAKTNDNKIWSGKLIHH